jgi:hypothetical protein
MLALVFSPIIAIQLIVGCLFSSGGRKESINADAE